MWITLQVAIKRLATTNSEPIVKTFIFLVLVLTSTLGKADFMTGNDLLSRLSSNNNQSHANGMGYVIGIADQFSYSRNFDALKGSFCFSIPSEVTAQQIGDVVQMWLEKHPKSRHFGAPGLVASGLEKAFPCKQGPK